MMSDDRRQWARIPLSISMAIEHPRQGWIEVATSDVSESGVFVSSSEMSDLEEGEEILVFILGLPFSGEGKLMRVVRVSDEGYGLTVIPGEDRAISDFKRTSAIQKIA